MTEPIRYQCCFCGQSVAYDAPDPCRLLVTAWDEMDQQELYAHVSCLKVAVHRSVPLLVASP